MSMGGPLQTGTCPDCGSKTYEEDNYGCGCRNKCPDCEEYYPEGPHRDCYDHWGAMDEDTKVEMFTELLEDRNRLKKRLEQSKWTFRDIVDTANEALWRYK